MNQIREWLKVISVCKDQVEAIESSYQNMPKGAIHERSLKYQKDRARDYADKIEKFGQGQIIIWEILYKREGQTNRDARQMTLNLDQSISESEIEDRLRLSGFTILGLKKSKFIKLGFPSFSENNQIGEI